MLNYLHAIVLIRYKYILFYLLFTPLITISYFKSTYLSEN